MAAASSKRAPDLGDAVDDDSSNASGVWTIGRADHEVMAYAVHDANSVLGALIVNVDWLRGALENHHVPGADEALDDVAICCSRLTGLLREALRSASGRPVRDGMRSIRVSSLASWVVDTMRRQAEAHHIAIDVIEGQDGLVLGEQVALERVLSNLLDNAIRFSRFGGRVVLSYGIENGAVALTVADEGPGVPVELQEQVFEAFQTMNAEPSPAAGSSEHTGLGLAFCRKVARAHGGDVRLTNRPIAGALFSVTLPILRN
jgi:signal transduction histidine kinase